MRAMLSMVQLCHANFAHGLLLLAQMGQRLLNLLVRLEYFAK